MNLRQRLANLERRHGQKVEPVLCVCKDNGDGTVTTAGEVLTWADYHERVAKAGGGPIIVLDV